MGEHASEKSFTPRQMALIGVLGTILVVVLIVQFGGASTSSEGAGAVSPAKLAAPPSEASDGKAPAQPSPSAASNSNAPTSNWPKMNGETAAAYDPFALPAALAKKLDEGRESKRATQSKEEAKRKASDDALATLQSRGASAVLRNERGGIAVIGNRTVRIGDLIEGYRVVSIDTKGVLLAPVRPTESREETKK